YSSTRVQRGSVSVIIAREWRERGRPASRRRRLSCYRGPGAEHEVGLFATGPARDRRPGTSLRRLPRLQHEHVYPHWLDELLELRWRPGERRKRPVVHRDDLPDAEDLACLRRPHRAHRVVIADRQKRDLRSVQLANEPHVPEERGIAGEIE